MVGFFGATRYNSNDNPEHNQQIIDMLTEDWMRINEVLLSNARNRANSELIDADNYEVNEYWQAEWYFYVMRN
jgi:hypothetical protein